MSKKLTTPRNHKQRQAIAELKAQYLAYYADLPQQNLAAASIGRDEDTILRWKQEDSEFADRCLRAKATWAMRKVRRVSDQFLLERLLKDEFAQRQEVTGKDGRPVQIETIVGIVREASEDIGPSGIADRSSQV